MNNIHRNTVSAIENSSYYNDLWLKLGTKLHYTELNRIRFITECIQEFTASKDLRILDLGCGRGWMAPFLSPFGKVTGIDFSSAGIQFAKENYGQFADFVLATEDSSPIMVGESNLFDVVVSSEVIEHVPNHGAYLEQVASYLRKDGWCMITTPNGNVWEQFKKDARFQPQLQPVENWITTNELFDLLSATGFEVIRHEGRPVYQFRIGLAGFLQRRYIEKTFDSLNYSHLYGRLILPTALYQMVAAQKKCD